MGQLAWLGSLGFVVDSLKNIVIPGRKVHMPQRSELKAFPISRLIDNSVTDFDLYLDVANTIVLYAPAPYHWLRDELQRLLNDGHGSLYYTTSDERKVEAYQVITAIPKVADDLPPPKRLLALNDAAAELTKVLFKHPLTQASLMKGREISDSMVKCIQEDRSCVLALGMLATHDQYTYYHSARVAAYALAMALQLSIRDDKLLQEMALGCLLHDIGKAKVPYHILTKTGPLDEAEWREIKLHPEYGFKMIEEGIVSLVPREVILHHHEREDGTGYPHGLTSAEIMDEVRIAAFADIYDALTSNRPYHIARTRYEALDFIRFRLLNKVSKDAFRAMVEIFAGEDKEKDKAG